MRAGSLLCLQEVRTKKHSALASLLWDLLPKCPPGLEKGRPPACRSRSCGQTLGEGRGSQLVKEGKRTGRENQELTVRETTGRGRAERAPGPYTCSGELSLPSREQGAVLGPPQLTPLPSPSACDPRWQPKETSRKGTIVAGTPRM